MNIENGHVTRGQLKLLCSKYKLTDVQTVTDYSVRQKVRRQSMLGPKEYTLAPPVAERGQLLDEL